MEQNTNPQRYLVVLITHGTDHELSSVAFTIANGGMTAGLKVSVFLTSAGVDLVRKRAADTTQVLPLEPLTVMIQDFLKRGGTLWACTPCVKARGYTQDDLIAGTVITGASVAQSTTCSGHARRRQAKRVRCAARKRRVATEAARGIRGATSQSAQGGQAGARAVPQGYAVLRGR